MRAERPRHLIDFHTHAFPEKVAARAMAALTTTYSVTPVAEPTIAGLMGLMEEVGVDVSVVTPVATRPEQVKSINDWAAESGSDRVVCFGTLHPELEELASETERVIARGLKGIKLQPNFQGFYPDDRRLWPAYEAAEGRLIVVFHSGQEITPLEQVHAQPEALARVHEAFPRLRMVVAHLGGYQMWGEVREHLIGRDLYLDTSYCPEEDLSDEDMVGLIRGHGAGRVVFATDFPWGHPGVDADRLCRLGLSQDEIEAIGWENAQELLGRALD